jgi:hypothetical protein
VETKISNLIELEKRAVVRGKERRREGRDCSVTAS